MLIIDSCIIFPFVLKYYRTEKGNVIGYSTFSQSPETPTSDGNVLALKYRPSEVQRMISNKADDNMDKKEADKLRSMTL